MFGGRATRILLIDDQPDVIVTLTLLLENEGYAAYSAENGRDALDVMEESPPDLVILDLWMPGMDGWQLLVRLRQPTHPLRDVPVIVLTADARAAGAALPVQSFLIKPVEVGELLARVRCLAPLAKGGYRAAPASVASSAA